MKHHNVDTFLSVKFDRFSFSRKSTFLWRSLKLIVYFSLERHNQPWARWIQEAILDLVFYWDRYVKRSSILIFNRDRGPQNSSIVEDSRKLRKSPFFSTFLDVPRGPQSWNSSIIKIKTATRVDLDLIFVKITDPSVDLAHAWSQRLLAKQTIRLYSQTAMF